MLSKSFFLLPILLIVACSHSGTQPSTETDAEDIDATPFEGLETVRVMPCFISKQIHASEMRNSLIEELGKLGKVHIPSDTSIEELQQAQNRKFGLFVLSLKEISVNNFEKSLPVFDITCTLYEESELAINKKKYMSIVWTKNLYMEVLPNQKANTDKASALIQSLVGEFAKKYKIANTSGAHLEFYVGSNVIQSEK